MEPHIEAELDDFIARVLAPHCDPEWANEEESALERSLRDDFINAERDDDET